MLRFLAMSLMVQCSEAHLGAMSITKNFSKVPMQATTPNALLNLKPADNKNKI